MMREVVCEQLERLERAYPGSTLEGNGKGMRVLFPMHASYDGVLIVRDCSLRLVLPDDYPYAIPKVYETTGTVPEGFVHRYADGSLCVGVPGQILIESPEGIDLVRFIEGPVAACLYSAFYQEKYGCMPFGERSHGATGILEYYDGLFSTTPEKTIVLMQLVAKGRYRGHLPCPCGSDRKLRDCHGNLIKKLSDPHLRTTVSADYLTVCRELEARHRHIRKRLETLNSARLTIRDYGTPT